MGKLTLAKAFKLYGHVYVNKNFYASVQFIANNATLMDDLQRSLKCGTISRGAKQYTYTFAFSKRECLAQFSRYVLAEKAECTGGLGELCDALLEYAGSQTREQRILAAQRVREASAAWGQEAAGNPPIRIGTDTAPGTTTV